MVRVQARVNGQLVPFVTMQVNTTGDAVTARRALLDQASSELGVALAVAHDEVNIYLDGGARINTRR